MQAIVFYLVLPFIYLISILPFWMLYGISDLMYFFMYYIIRYRRDVVNQNLRNSFPDKTPDELNKISKKYYQYLCDMTLESLKKLTMTKKQILKHCEFNETSVLKKLFDENKSVILLMGHYGNWEWAGPTFTLKTGYQLYVIYQPLSNKYWENLMVKSRTMFGVKLIKVSNTLRDMISYKNIVNATAFIADQTPFPDNAFWTMFLNQDTPVFTGAEKLGKKLNYPIVFINIVRKKRGYYEIFAELLEPEPKNTAENEISERFINRLEKEIIKKPETWLWSHRRWKHKRKDVPIS